MSWAGLPNEPVGSVRPPLDSGPQPLTRRSARWWAVLIVGVSLGIGLLLPALAEVVASFAVPPGAVRFGAASVIPADGWVLEESGPDLARLSSGGVVAQFDYRTEVGPVGPLLERATAEAIQADDTLTQSGPPTAFDTPTGAPGLVRAVVGANSTAVVAAVADRRGAGATMTAAGEAKQVAAVVADLDRMVRSIRLSESRSAS